MTDLVTEPVVGSLASAEGPRPLRPVRAAIVGLGRAGILHAAVLSTIPDCELVGVADPRASARRNLKGLGYAAASFGAVDKLLAKARPEALFLCLPPDAQAVAARAAIEAGVGVLVERPFFAGRAEAEAVAALAAERGVPLACAHPLIDHPVFAAAGRALAAGVLGRVRQARASMFVSWVFSARQKLELAPPQAPGGVAAQPASDLIFFLAWRLGVPVEVKATWNKIYGDHEDELHAMMRLESGAEIGCDTSWSVPGYPRPATVIEIEGENGKLLAADDALELELIVPGAGFRVGVTRLGHTELPAPARFDLGGDAAYLTDAAFLRWVTGGDPVPAVASRALDVLRITEALYASARQGGKPVAVAS
jgi:predicted dehydrogenase